MATKEEALKAWQTFRDGVRQKTPYRFALTGDGKGNATSNLYVAQKSDYIYVREYSDLKRYFPVLNRGRVGPYLNMPVVLGYEDTEPDREQVLTVNYDALPAGNSASVNYTIGRHHWQHEFGGGDEVWVDSRQFVPGLVLPTNPPSMNVEVRPFLYYYNEWSRFAGSTTDSLSQYKPNAGESFSRYVLISLDQDTGSLVLKPGLPITTQATFDALLSAGSEIDSIDYLPHPTPHEIPLGAAHLTSATTTISWTTAASNLIDARMHLGFSIDDIIERITTIEATLGIANSLPVTGAANFPTPDQNDYLNQWQVQPGTNNIFRIDSSVGINVFSPDKKLHVGGDIRLGELNPLNTSTLPGEGRRLYFSGGPAGNTWNSENSDELSIFRWNASTDATELRIQIGDNLQGADKFVIGTAPGNNWQEKFAVAMDGKTIMSTPSAASANDLPASSLTFYVKQSTSQLIFLVKYNDGVQSVAGSVTLS